MDNRVIKFRVWNVIDKILLYPDGQVDLVMFLNGGLFSRFEKTIEYPPNYVIQQFTGLLDKNGAEIYEGDILQCYKKIKCLKQPEYPKFEKYSWDDPKSVSEKVEDLYMEVKFDKNSDYDDFYCDGVLGWVILDKRFNHNKSLISTLNHLNGELSKYHPYWEEIEKYAIIVGNIFENPELCN